MASSQSNSSPSSENNTTKHTITLTANGNIGGKSLPYLEGEGFSILKKYQRSMPSGIGRNGQQYYNNWVPAENIQAFAKELKKHCNIVLELIPMSEEAKAEQARLYGKKNAEKKAEAKAKRAEEKTTKDLASAIELLRAHGIKVGDQ